MPPRSTTHYCANVLLTIPLAPTAAPSSEDIVILTPYLGQVRVLRREMARVRLEAVVGEADRADMERLGERWEDSPSPSSLEGRLTADTGMRPVVASNAHTCASGLQVLQTMRRARSGVGRRGPEGRRRGARRQGWPPKPQWRRAGCVYPAWITSRWGREGPGRRGW